MASSKHGRLFTEADLRRIAASAYGNGLTDATEKDEIDLDEEAFARALIAELDDDEITGGPTFPADEPLFLLRGQDKAAKGAVNAYLDECEAIGCGHAHIAAVDTAKVDLVVWQENYSHRVKVPD